MDQSNPSQKNRRAFRRRSPRGKPKIACYKGSMDLGANLAVTLLDLSESGIRMVVRAPLEPGQEVTMGLEGTTHQRPIKVGGKVVWSVATQDGNHCIGIRLDKYLPYQEINKLT